VIRKLWVGEAKYRDHVLRLDPESRHNRFAGGVSDDFVRSYVDLSISLDTVVHGFFLNGAMRGSMRPPWPITSSRIAGTPQWRFFLAAVPHGVARVLRTDHSFEQEGREGTHS
jgi:hypothetical protein